MIKISNRLGLGLLLAVILLTPCWAPAATYTVTNNDTSGPGSLADAVNNANANRGPHVIEFSMRAVGTHPVRIPVRDLVVTEELLIDGWSQPGSVLNTNLGDAPFNGEIKVEFTAEGVAGTLPIITLMGTNSVIRGVAFTGPAAGSALLLHGFGGHSIQGCFVGLRAGGTFAPAYQNFSPGIITLSNGNTIGGTDPSHRNVIAGNEDHQISLQSNDNSVQGNIVGLLPDGDTPVDAFPAYVDVAGIWVNGDNNLIGGAVVGGRNIISNQHVGVQIIGGDANIVRRNRIGTDIGGTLARGNRHAGMIVNHQATGTIIGGRVNGGDNVISGNGIGIFNLGTGTIIRRNLIGVGAGGAPLGNTRNGILLSNLTSTTRIGGSLVNDGNTIAYNGYGGVTSNHPQDLLTIRRNSIFANEGVGSGAASGLGIDLGLSGVSVNDVPDVDGVTNRPHLTQIDTSTPGAFVVTGVVEPVTNPPYAIEFFGNSECDPTGYGEGKTYRGRVTTSSAVFNHTLPSGVAIGNWLTATATDASGNTSEFSLCLEVTSTTTVTNTYDSGVGSLRWAMDNANSNPGADVIDFKIPGSGPHVITTNSSMPLISEQLTIDGTTQDGWSQNTIVGAPGFNAVLPITIQGVSNPVAAFVVDADGCVLKGLHITGFFEAVWLGVATAGANSKVQGCLFEGNNDAILANKPGCEIGGTSMASRNCIRDNSDIGIKLSSTGNSVLGNSIGTNDAGNAAAGNRAGILVSSGGNGIDGDLAPNYIGGNDVGIEVQNSGNRVVGNEVGMTGLGNTGHGILVSGSNNVFGGVGPGEANAIVGNGGDGIRILAGTGNEILENSIDDNGGLGIDLGGDGVTPNDDGVADDIDSGPNNLLNFPLLAYAALAGCGTVVAAGFDGAPNLDVTIDFYYSADCDPSGHGEGGSYLGSHSVTTNASGFVSFELCLPAAPEGSHLSALARTSDGSSEFAACVQVYDAMTVVNTSPAGQGSLFNALLVANRSPGLDSIDFDIPGPGPHFIDLWASPAYEPISIDGSTQPGYVPNTAGPDQPNNAQVMIDVNITIPVGKRQDAKLTLLDEGSVLRGLRFRGEYNTDALIVLGGAGGHTIEGCEIGMVESFATSDADVIVDVLVGSDNNVIGGPLPDQQNLVGGGDTHNLRIASAGNVIEGNRIGISRLGDTGVASTPTGLSIGGAQAAGNRVGGTTAGQRNIISGHTGSGVVLSGGSNELSGNYIGTDFSGTAGVPNELCGVQISGPETSAVGGHSPDEANVIAFNGGPGVWITDVSPEIPRGSVLINSIFGNTGLGIDLENDGVTANDPGDPWQDQPVLVSVVGNPASTSVQGEITTMSTNTSVQLFFYAQDDCDASGYGEGAEYLGHEVIDIGGASTTDFQVDLPVSATRRYITAMAVWNGRSSEFSACVRAIDGTKTAAPPSSAPTVLALRQAVPNPFNPSTTIGFDLPKPGRVDLVVYDVRGQRVRELVGRELSAGRHDVRWDGRDDSGSAVASGVYLARLQSGGEVRSSRMVLLK